MTDEVETTKPVGLPCCCGKPEANHPNNICTEWHWYESTHHHLLPQEAATPHRDLLHLLAMKVIWPRGAGRQHFKTELALDRAIEDCLDEELRKKAEAT